MSGYTIRTPHGFVGRASLCGPLAGNHPLATAYVWDALDDAAVVGAAFAHSVICDGGGQPVVNDRPLSWEDVYTSLIGVGVSKRRATRLADHFTRRGVESRGI